MLQKSDIDQLEMVLLMFGALLEYFFFMIASHFC